jgi:hypothetical protein
MEAASRARWQTQALDLVDTMVPPPTTGFPTRTSGYQYGLSDLRFLPGMFTANSMVPDGKNGLVPGNGRRWPLMPTAALFVEAGHLM